MQFGLQRLQDIQDVPESGAGAAYHALHVRVVRFQRRPGAFGRDESDGAGRRVFVAGPCATVELALERDNPFQQLQPGIASALLTTVVGLLVAIPTALGSNHPANRIQFLCVQLENFPDKFASRLQQTFLDED